MGDDEPVNSAASGHGDPFDGPVTVDLLANLQAGLLDDETAAGLRRRACTDPDVARDLARLDRIRRDVAHLGVDADSAAEIPADVAARVGAALSNQPPLPGRGGGRRASAGRAPLVRFKGAAAAIGLVAVVAAGAVGTAMLLRNDSARPTAAALRRRPRIPARRVASRCPTRRSCRCSHIPRTWASWPHRSDGRRV